MQTQVKIIGIYIAILLIGGLIGYVAAKSWASLIASSVSAALLTACCYGIRQGSKLAYCAALALISCLLLFFGYRFSLHYQFMPAGLMTVLTASLLIYLLASLRKTCKSCCR